MSPVLCLGSALVVFLQTLVMGFVRAGLGLVVSVQGNGLAGWRWWRLAVACPFAGG